MQERDNASLHRDAAALLILAGVHEAQLPRKAARNDAVACQKRVSEYGLAMVHVCDDACINSVHA